MAQLITSYDEITRPEDSPQVFKGNITEADEASNLVVMAHKILIMEPLQHFEILSTGILALVILHKLLHGLEIVVERRKGECHFDRIRPDLHTWVELDDFDENFPDVGTEDYHDLRQRGS